MCAHWNGGLWRAKQALIKLQQHGDSVTIQVRVHPKAKRERIAGEVGNAIKLELTAPPVEGRANEACIRFFADLLKVPRSAVSIAAGVSSRNKVIRISGVDAVKIEQAIAAALS